MTPTKTIAEAVRYFSEHGYAGDLDTWMHAIRASIMQEQGMVKPPAQMAQAALEAIYSRTIKGSSKYHKGMPKFTIEQVQPRLRSVLQARILASADLIKLNRDDAMEVTLRRFAGWASSQTGEEGGTAEARRHIGKRLQQSTFEDRRMLIDQGHKLVAAVNQTIADGGGAIAAQWHHVHQANYDARPEHVARDDRIYLIRDSWAHQQGLVKRGANGYTDEITQPAYEPYCRCFFTYFYSLSRIPADMLTEKGRVVMEQTRLRVA